MPNLPRALLKIDEARVAFGGATAALNEAIAAIGDIEPVDDVATWRLPVCDNRHPASDWYIYTHHDLTGRRNPLGYAHTGWDCNARWGGRGDVDIGEPVFAITDGEVVDLGWSSKYRGGVILRVDHFGVPLYVRYWHIAPAKCNIFAIGETVEAGRQLGTIDKYPSGWAHLHFDMAWQPIKHNWWFTRHKEIEWANPTYILRAHRAPGIDEILVPG